MFLRRLQVDGTADWAGQAADVRLLLCRRRWGVRGDVHQTAGQGLRNRITGKKRFLHAGEQTWNETGEKAFLGRAAEATGGAGRQRHISAAGRVMLKSPSASSGARLALASARPGPPL